MKDIEVTRSVSAIIFLIRDIPRQFSFKGMVHSSKLLQGRGIKLEIQ